MAKMKKTKAKKATTKKYVEKRVWKGIKDRRKQNASLRRKEDLGQAPY